MSKSFASILSQSEMDIFHPTLETLPRLIYNAKHSDYQGLDMGSTLEAFNVRHPEIVSAITSYWTEALKNNETKLNISSNHFNSLSSSEQYSFVHSSMRTATLGGPTDAIKLLIDDVSHRGILTRLLPVLILASDAESLRKYLRVIMASRFTVEYLSIIAQNCSSNEFCLCLLDALGLSNQETRFDNEHDHQDNVHMNCRRFRILLSVASKDTHLALWVRNGLSRNRRYPNLCIEITNRFTKDMISLVNVIVSCSTQLSGHWFFSNLNQEIIKSMAAAIVREMNTAVVENFDQVNSRIITISAKALVVLTSIGLGSVQPFLPCSSKDIRDSVRPFISVPSTPASSPAGSGAIGEPYTRADSNVRAVIALHTLRLILLAHTLASSQTSAASAAGSSGSSGVGGSTGQKGPGWTMEEAKAEYAMLGESLLDALAAQRALIRRGGDGGVSEFDDSYTDMKKGVAAAAAQSAHAHNLFLRVAAEFDCRTAILSMALDELDLSHITDLMPSAARTKPPAGTAVVTATTGTADDACVTFSALPSQSQSFPPLQGRVAAGRQSGSHGYASAAATAAAAGSAFGVGVGVGGMPQRLRQYYRGCLPHSPPTALPVPNTALRVLAQATQASAAKVAPTSVVAEFSSLDFPPVISGSAHRPGDWLSCLALFFGCDLFRRASAGEGEVGQGVALAGVAPEQIHALMTEVLLRARWPPHPWIQRCLDWWLLRCLQVRDPIDLLAGPSSQFQNQQQQQLVSRCRLGGGGGGTPLLPGEVASFLAPLHHERYRLDFVSNRVCLSCQTNPRDVHAVSALCDDAAALLKAALRRREEEEEDPHSASTATGAAAMATGAAATDTGDRRVSKCKCNTLSDRRMPISSAVDAGVKSFFRVVNEAKARAALVGGSRNRSTLEHAPGGSLTELSTYRSQSPSFAHSSELGNDSASVRAAPKPTAASVIAKLQATFQPIDESDSDAYSAIQAAAMVDSTFSSVLAQYCTLQHLALSADLLSTPASAVALAVPIENQAIAASLQLLVACCGRDAVASHSMIAVLVRLTKRLAPSALLPDRVPALSRLVIRTAERNSNSNSDSSARSTAGSSSSSLVRRGESTGTGGMSGFLIRGSQLDIMNEKKAGRSEVIEIAAVSSSVCNRLQVDICLLVRRMHGSHIYSPHATGMDSIPGGLLEEPRMGMDRKNGRISGIRDSDGGGISAMGVPLISSQGIESLIKEDIETVLTTALLPAVIELGIQLPLTGAFPPPSGPSGDCGISLAEHCGCAACSSLLRGIALSSLDNRGILSGKLDTKEDAGKRKSGGPPIVRPQCLRMLVEVEPNGGAALWLLWKQLRDVHPSPHRFDLLTSNTLLAINADGLHLARGPLHQVAPWDAAGFKKSVEAKVEVVMERGEALAESKGVAGSQPSLERWRHRTCDSLGGASRPRAVGSYAQLVEEPLLLYRIQLFQQLGLGLVRPLTQPPVAQPLAQALDGADSNEARTESSTFTTSSTKAAVGRSPIPCIVPLLTNPVVLRIVAAVTRALLVESRAVVRETIACKVLTTDSIAICKSALAAAATGNVPHVQTRTSVNSTAVVGASINPSTFIDVQELMAVNLLLNLWSSLVSMCAAADHGPASASVATRASGSNSENLKAWEAEIKEQIEAFAQDESSPSALQVDRARSSAERAFLHRVARSLGLESRSHGNEPTRIVSVFKRSSSSSGGPSHSSWEKEDGEEFECAAGNSPSRSRSGSLEETSSATIEIDKFALIDASSNRSSDDLDSTTRAVADGNSSSDDGSGSGSNTTASNLHRAKRKRVATAADGVDDSHDTASDCAALNGAIGDGSCHGGRSRSGSRHFKEMVQAKKSAVDWRGALCQTPCCSPSQLAELRLPIAELLNWLMETNPRICELLLHSGISETSFQLLSSQRVPSLALGRCLLQMTLKIAGTDSTRIFDSAPKLEALLRHTVYQLQANTSADVNKRLALSIPGFLFRSIRGLNSNLTRAETKSVERLFESVTQTIAERYPQVLQTMRSLAERPAVKGTEDDKRMMHKLREVVRLVAGANDGAFLQKQLARQRNGLTLAVQDAALVHSALAGWIKDQKQNRKFETIEAKDLLEGVMGLSDDETGLAAMTQTALATTEARSTEMTSGGIEDCTFSDEISTFESHQENRRTATAEDPSLAAAPFELSILAGAAATLSASVASAEAHTSNIAYDESLYLASDESTASTLREKRGSSQIESVISFDCNERDNSASVEKKQRN